MILRETRVTVCDHAHNVPSHGSTMHRSTFLRTAGLLAGLLLTACSQGSSPEASNVAPGTLLQNSSASDGFTYFLAGSHFGGGASSLVVERVLWGRLVDLYAEDPVSGLRQKLIRDFLVRPELQSDGTDYELEIHPVTQREELTILHAFGTPGFEAAFQPLRDEVGLPEFIDKGMSANVLPPFTAVPRNAAVVVEFNDLLDPATVNGSNVRALVGYPPTTPFEARIVPDRSRGGLVGSTQYSTRIIIDPTISSEEAQELGLSVNARGFPGATTALLINGGLRIPTKINTTAAQFQILRNLSGNGPSLADSGSADTGSPTLDIVRGFRTGGSNLATGDLYNGYLYDVDPPVVMGTLQLSINSATGPVAPNQYLATLTYEALACAVQPRAGDLLTANNGVFEVLTPGAPLAGATVTDVGLLWLGDASGTSSAPQLGPGELRTPWTSGIGLNAGCFLTFEEPADVPPVEDVPTNATMRITFSEAMDPDRVNAFDGVKITDNQVLSTNLLKRTVVGKVAASSNLLSFVFQPSMPFRHDTGGNETFDVDIISFTDLLTGRIYGVTDLAGNTMGDLLPQVTFDVRDSDPEMITGGVSLRFESIDEDGNGQPEVRGQVVPNLSQGKMQPRAVTRFSTFLDTTGLSSAFVQNFGPPLGGVVEPLSIYGSRVHAIWRYADMGFDLMDETYFNIDVEGLAWMIAGSGVQIDQFPEFEMSLAHSFYMPDEEWNQDPLAPVLIHPLSGLTTTFADNVADDLEVVSTKTNGYFIQSIDQFKTPSDTLMMPFPLNRNMPASAYSYFTWRDTTKQVVGGPNNGGVPIPQGGPVPAGPVIYQTNLIPTLGLPLLMDFKTFPAPTTANGLNLLNIAGVNSIIPTAAAPFNLPFYRAHSTGGIDANQAQQLIDPSTELTAIGGLDGFGAPTPATDNGFYYGNADFVTRVSVMHTIWFNTGGISNFAPAVTLPAPNEVPPGVEMHFAYRGATIVTLPNQNNNANNYDPYGNPLPPSPPFAVTFLNGDSTWKSDLTELNGAQYIQVRVTFVSNAETSAVPELDSIGIPYANL